MRGEKERLLLIESLGLFGKVFERANRLFRIVSSLANLLESNQISLAFKVTGIPVNRRHRENLAHEERHGGRVLDVLPLLVTVLENEVPTFMRQDGCQLRLVLQARNQSKVHVDDAVGKREGIEMRRMRDAHLDRATKLRMYLVHHTLQIR